MNKTIKKRWSKRMFYEKITVGFVIQTFGEDGNFIDQEFIASDQVDYEIKNGLSIDVSTVPLEVREHHPFTMVSPLNDDSTLD